MKKQTAFTVVIVAVLAFGLGVARDRHANRILCRLRDQESAKKTKFQMISGIRFPDRFRTSV
jgi:hypothetical protein